jgi:hypothetical protein
MSGVPTSAAASKGELADEARERRQPAEVDRRDEVQHRDHGRRAHEPLDLEDRGRPGTALDEPDREEERGLHDDVVDHVVDGRAEGHGVAIASPNTR